jgi:preprotein translocase subunit SecA
MVDSATEGFAEEWDLAQLWTDLGQIWSLTTELSAVVDDEGVARVDHDELVEMLKADARGAYAEREAELGPEVLRELERRVLLSVLDRKWREHLYEMDYLREGIYLRAYSQRDPLVEYQREGFDMFAAMMDGIKEEAVGFLFNLEVQVEEEPEQVEELEELEVAEPMRRPVPDAVHPREAPQIRAKGLERPQQPTQLAYSAPSEDGAVAVTAMNASHEDEYAGVGRNADCPCGSGKKYKKCHGAPGGPTGLTARING